jgi:hypothetical protein
MPQTPKPPPPVHSPLTPATLASDDVPDTGLSIGIISFFLVLKFAFYLDKQERPAKVIIGLRKFCRRSF